MTLPDPKPGLVVRYDYLWTPRGRHPTGAGQGPTRLPCRGQRRHCAAALCRATADHPPDADGGHRGHRDPDAVKQAIGLDDAPSWVIVSEHNVDEWPKGGLSPVPGQAETFTYGFLPPGLFAQVKAAFLELARTKKTGAVRR